eukprot:scaffold44411_cov71-Phaeocystis_antarctica.AAC.5
MKGLGLRAWASGLGPWASGFGLRGWGWGWGWVGGGGARHEYRPLAPRQCAEQRGRQHHEQLAEAEHARRAEPRPRLKGGEAGAVLDEALTGRSTGGTTRRCYTQLHSRERAWVGRRGEAAPPPRRGRRRRCTWAAPLRACRSRGGPGSTRTPTARCNARCAV